MTNKTFKQRLVSETSVFDNSTDPNRRIGISAEITVKDGRVTSVSSGIVTNLANEETLADFSAYRADRVNFRVRSTSELSNSEVLADVEAFIADIKANIAEAHAE